VSISRLVEPVDGCPKPAGLGGEAPIRWHSTNGRTILLKVDFNSGGTFSAPADAAVAFLVFEDLVLSSEAKEADAATHGALSRAATLGSFAGRAGEVVAVAAPAASKAAQFILVGVGAKRDSDDLAIEQAAGQAYRTAEALKTKTLVLHCEGLSPVSAAHAALAARLGSYRFERHFTVESRRPRRPAIESLTVIVKEAALAAEAYADLAHVADGIEFARDLVWEPPNILYPEEFARRAKELETRGLIVDVLGEAEMAALGMGALLCVGQGSPRESQLIVIQWKGGGKDEAPLAFVGKGVCFDSGGVTLKAGKGMEKMKYDMAGAAAIAGLMCALAGRRAKVNAVGVLGVVENMPDGVAVRPSDVVTSMSGQTIEIISTDAEGRLVLADAVWYAQDRFDPLAVVDLATLTGAVQVALGREYAGLYSNDDALGDALVAASNAENERLWRMPLPPRHEKQIESTVADMKNHDDTDVGGGSITGAQFVQRFVNGRPWAHLDISARAWRESSTDTTVPDGATGYGVRLLHRFVSDYRQ
jgi:leucyl aminopeptidase